MIAAERALPAHIPYRPMSMLCWSPISTIRMYREKEGFAGFAAQCAMVALRCRRYGFLGLPCLLIFRLAASRTAGARLRPSCQQAGARALIFYTARKRDRKCDLFFVAEKEGCHIRTQFWDFLRFAILFSAKNPPHFDIGNRELNLPFFSNFRKNNSRFCIHLF